MHQYLHDFEFEQAITKESIHKYKNLVPDEIIDFWTEYGLGTFMNGYMKSVNPDEFSDLFQNTNTRYHHAVVLFATGMGDLIVWSDEYIRLVNYRHGAISTIMHTFQFFFEDTAHPEFRKRFLSWDPYEEARNRHGKLAYDECFGYTPLLGIGGPEKVENLKKVKLKEHILVITELMGPIE